MAKRRRAAREPLENETMVAARERQLSRLLTVVVGSVVGIALLILGVGLFRQTAVVAPKSVDHTPVVHPTPVLTPALDFVDGMSEVAEGQALFVEYWIRTTGEGDCEQIYIDFPTYSFQGNLTGEGFHELPANRSRIIVGIGYSLGGTAGSGISSSLAAVDLLPYEIGRSHPKVVLRAVAGDGALVAEIDGERLWIPPRKRWRYVVETQVGGNCRETDVITLDNRGLLSNEQIDVPYWDGVTWRDFQPGMVQPTPVAIPCEVFQPLGGEGWIWDIENGDDGSIWIAGNGGVARLDPQDHTWRTFGQSEGLPTGDVSVRLVTPDTNGTAWLAFWNGPLYYFDGERWDRFGGSGDLRLEMVLAISIAPDGSVWFGTTNGAFQWDRKSDAWNHLTKEDGLHSDVVSDILFSPDGKVWFANIEGVSYFDQRNLAGGSDAWWSRSDQPHTDGYEVAMASGDGKVWFGGQRYFDAANQSWADTVYSGFAYDITVDDRGGLWVGIDEGAVYIPDPDHSLPTDWQFFAMANGLGGNSIRSLAVDADGGVWFGAENSTVSRCTFEH